jgi:hypothetical protein
MDSSKMTMGLIIKLLIVARIFGLGSPSYVHEKCKAERKQGCAIQYKWHEFSACFAVCSSWHLCSAAASLAHARATHQSLDKKLKLLKLVESRASLCKLQ